MNINKQVLAALILTVGLQACGGSSGSSDDGGLRPTPVPPTTGSVTPIVDNQSIQIVGDTNVSAGQSVALSVLAKSGRDINSTQWRQVAGPTVALLSENSQTIGFDVKQTGNYSFEAEVLLDGETSPNTYSVSLSAGGNQQTTVIRLDHAVSELGKVSLQVMSTEGKRIQSVNWSQTAGPQAQNVSVQDAGRTSDTTDRDAYLFFDAPSVDRDSVIQYRANVNYVDGTSGTDVAFVTVRDVQFDTNGLFYGNGTSVTEDMHAYRKDSPYKQSLERCVYGNNIPNPPTCTFNDLPLIGMQLNNPSVDDILDRTLVSHQWMGDNFKEFLTNSDSGQDMRLLLRGVTAIVISYDVRPSFYWSATGAIYLDANNFWRTPEQRDTLNDQPDFRSDFGSELQFSVFWRYVKNNDYYPATSFPVTERNERSFADMEATISWLMYHELAHANDFFPPSSWSGISRATTPLSYFRNNGTSSDVLDQRFPLRSNEMHELAQVRFRNETPTAVQRNYRGVDVETFFVPDISASFYSYLTTREDFATLVERYLMAYRLGAEADVAIIDGRTPSDEALVVWGQRNRISEPSLEDRTVFAVDRVYPELGNVRNNLQGLNAPILMTPNRGWLENLDISPTVNNARQSLDIRVPYSIEYIKQRERNDSRSVHEGRPDL